MKRKSFLVRLVGFFGLSGIVDRLAGETPTHLIRSEVEPEVCSRCGDTKIVYDKFSGISNLPPDAYVLIRGPCPECVGVTWITPKCEGEWETWLKRDNPQPGDGFHWRGDLDGPHGELLNEYWWTD